MKRIFLVIHRMELFFQRLAEFTAAFMMVFLTTAALTRRLLRPLPSTFEISSEYLIIALVFLPLAYTYREGWHIKVDYFEQFIPKKIYPFFANLIVPIIGFIFFYLIARQSYIRTIKAIAVGKRSASILAYPLAPAYFIVAIGASIICLYLLEAIIEKHQIGKKSKDTV